MSKKFFIILALMVVFSSLFLVVIYSKSASAYCSSGYTKRCTDAAHSGNDWKCVQTCTANHEWGNCECTKLCDHLGDFTSLSCAGRGKVKATCHNGGTVTINCGALTPADRAKVSSCCAEDNTPLSSSTGGGTCLVGSCIYDNCVEKQIPSNGGSCPSAGCTGSSQCLAKMKECTKDSDCSVDNPCVVASCKPSFVAEDEVNHIKRCHYDIFSKDFEPCGDGKYCYFGNCTTLTCSQFGGKCVDSVGQGYVEVNVSCSGGKVCEVKSSQGVSTVSEGVFYFGDIGDAFVVNLDSSHFVVAYTSDNSIYEEFGAVRVGHFDGSHIVWDVNSSEFSWGYTKILSLKNLGSGYFLLTYVGCNAKAVVRVGHFDGSKIVWDVDKEIFGFDGSLLSASVSIFNSSDFILSGSVINWSKDFGIIYIGHFDKLNKRINWKVKSNLSFSGAPHYHNLHVSYLNSSYFILLMDNKVRVGHFDGSKIVWDTSFLSYSDYEYLDSSSISALNSKYFVIYYKNVLDSGSIYYSDYDYVRVGHFDYINKKIVFDTPPVESNKERQSRGFIVVPLQNDHFLISFEGESLVNRSSNETYNSKNWINLSKALGDYKIISEEVVRFGHFDEASKKIVWDTDELTSPIFGGYSSFPYNDNYLSILDPSHVVFLYDFSPYENYSYPFFYPPHYGIIQISALNFSGQMSRCNFDGVCDQGFGEDVSSCAYDCGCKSNHDCWLNDNVEGICSAGVCYYSGSRGLSEHYPFEGTSEQRLSLLSRFLLNFSRSEGFGVVGLFCGGSSVVFPRYDSLKGSLGCVLSGDVGERVGGFVLSNSFKLSDVLSVLNLSDTDCGNVWSSNSNKDGWFSCAGKRVWLNPVRGLLVFGSSGVDFGGVSFWLDPFSVLVRFVRRLLYSGVVGVGDLAGYSSFRGLYYFVQSRPFGVHRVVGVLNGSGLFVDFAGFCSNVSSFLPRGEGVVSSADVSRHNFVFGVGGGSAGAVWPLVSGGLRVGGGGCECTPLSKDIVCSGLECGFVSDGCGGFVGCGSCGSGSVCSGNHCCPSGRPVWNGSACVKMNSSQSYCSNDFDCDDKNSCTVDKCYNHKCTHSYVKDGISCGFGLSCHEGACLASDFNASQYFPFCSQEDFVSFVGLDSSHFIVVHNNPEGYGIIRVGHPFGSAVVWDTANIIFDNHLGRYHLVSSLGDDYFVVLSFDPALGDSFISVGYFNKSDDKVYWDVLLSKFDSNVFMIDSVAFLSNSTFVISYEKRKYFLRFNLSYDLKSSNIIRVGHFDKANKRVVWRDSAVIDSHRDSLSKVVRLSDSQFVAECLWYEEVNGKPTGLRHARGEKLVRGGKLVLGEYSNNKLSLTEYVNNSLFNWITGSILHPNPINNMMRLDSSHFILVGKPKYGDSWSSLFVGHFGNSKVVWDYVKNTDIRSTFNIIQLVPLNNSYFVVAYSNFTGDYYSGESYAFFIRTGYFNGSNIVWVSSPKAIKKWSLEHGLTSKYHKFMDFSFSLLNSSHLIMFYKEEYSSRAIVIYWWKVLPVPSHSSYSRNSSHSRSSACSYGEVCTCCKRQRTWGKDEFVCEPGGQLVDPHYYLGGRCDLDCSSYGGKFRGYCVVDKDAPPVKHCPVGEVCACCEDNIGESNNPSALLISESIMCSLGGSVLVPPVRPLLRCSKSCSSNEKSYCVNIPNLR